MAVTRWDARAAWMEQSRDQWKAKAQERTKENKRLKVRVADVSNSRSEWRNQAEAAAGKLQEQEERIETLQRELAALQAELEKKSRSSSRIPPSGGMDMEQGRSG